MICVVLPVPVDRVGRLSGGSNVLVAPRPLVPLFSVALLVVEAGGSGVLSISSATSSSESSNTTGSAFLCLLPVGLVVDLVLVDLDRVGGADEASDTILAARVFLAAGPVLVRVVFF